MDCHCLDYVRHAGAFGQERGQHAVQKSDISPDDGIVTPQQREAVTVVGVYDVLHCVSHILPQENVMVWLLGY